MDATPSSSPSAPAGEHTPGGQPAAARPGAERTPVHRPVRTGLVAALLGIAAVVVLLDQLAKAWAVRRLGDGSSIDVLGPLVQLRLFRNPGAAFSFATGTTWIFTIVAIVVSVVIIRTSRRLGSRGWTLALGLLLGGAIGNLLDRLFREPSFGQGHVVDFVDLPNLFVFNLADAAITCAAVLIALLGLRGVGIEGDRGTGIHGDGAGEA